MLRRILLHMFSANTRSLLLSMLFFIFSVFLSEMKGASADSMLNLLKTPLPDTEKANTLMRIARAYGASDFQKSIDYAYKALKISEDLNNDKLIAKSQEAIGTLFFPAAQYDSAMYHYNIALLYCNENKYPLLFGNIMRNIGTIYFYTSNYNKALEAYFKCLSASQKLNNPGSIGKDLGNIGNIYKEQGKYKEALDYYNRSRLLVLKADKPHQLIALDINTGNVYYEMAKQNARQKKNIALYDSAMYYYLAAQSVLTASPDSSALSMLYCNMANIYTDKQQFAQATNLYAKAIDIRNRTEDFNQIAVLYENMASCYIEMNELDRATKYLDLAFISASENNSFEDLATLYKDYAVIAKEKKEFEKAYKYYVLHKQYADSAFNDESIEKRKELEMNFSFEKEREQKRVEEKANLVIRAEENKRNHVYIALSIGAFVVALLIAIIIYRNYSVVRKAHGIISKQKNEIEKQKDIVEEKQKEILDSIRYAKRIQLSLLASEKYIQRQMERLWGK